MLSDMGEMLAIHCDGMTVKLQNNVVTTTCR